MPTGRNWVAPEPPPPQKKRTQVTKNKHEYIGQKYVRPPRPISQKQRIGLTTFGTCDETREWPQKRNANIFASFWPSYIPGPCLPALLLQLRVFTLPVGQTRPKNHLKLGILPSLLFVMLCKGTPFIIKSKAI